MENNAQQQHTVSKTKKKSKNKKQSPKSEFVLPENTAKATVNGLSEKLDELNLHGSAAKMDVNLPKLNGNVEENSNSAHKYVNINGLDHNHLHHEEEHQHQISNHTPAADKINGDSMAAATVRITDGNIKSKFKSNKVKNKQSNDCHTNAHETNCMLHMNDTKHKYTNADGEHDNNVTTVPPQSTVNNLENGFNHNTCDMQSDHESLLPAESKESFNCAVDNSMESIQNHEAAPKTIADCVTSDTKEKINSNTAKQSIATAVEHEQTESQQDLALSPTKTTSSPSTTATDLETSLSPTLDLTNVHIEYKEYESELQMHDIMRLIQAELSEPYSIYTYRYFIYNWPKLCFLAAHGNEYVGAIVCKLDMHMNVRRGYIAMLAVRKEYRKLKIGTTLVQKAIEAMLADNADEVVLETEMRNLPALRLYENLGFVRDKRLFRYYLNGVDALRLKLWFR